MILKEKSLICFCVLFVPYLNAFTINYGYDPGSHLDFIPCHEQQIQSDWNLVSYDHSILIIRFLMKISHE